MPIVAPPPVPPITNRADSASAAAFAVELKFYSTLPGAILKLQQDGKNLTAATFSPTMIDGAEWFQFVAGAYEKRTEADSLLTDLGRRRLLAIGEKVVRLPFAFLVDSNVAAPAAPRLVAMYVDRGQPVYALRQSNGTAWLLIGAFESPEKASLYLKSLKASGVAPVLVYRKGRAF
jgi:hypothetical protein